MPNQVTIQRAPFLAALKKINTVASERGTLPILTCVLISTNNDVMTLTGSDLERTIQVHVPLDPQANQGSIKVAIVARRLTETVKSLPSDAPITLSESNNYWVYLESGSVKAKLAGLHPDEFPQLPDFAAAPKHTIPAAALLTLADRVAFSISTDAARAAFCGGFLCMNPATRELEMVTTDGHRLSKSGVKVDDAVIDGLALALGTGVIIPGQAIRSLSKVLDAAQDVEVQVKGDDMAVTSGDTRATFRLIPGRFPNFTQVVPAESSILHRVNVPRVELETALKRAANYTAKTGNTRLTYEPGVGLLIHAFDHEIGDFQDTVACEVSGSAISAGYNYRYLLDVLGATESQTIELLMAGAEAPTTFRVPGEPSTVYIVMPMQF